MGHTRLAIIDLNTGAQPICNEDKTVWIVFNGEIYNYPVLREELLKRATIVTPNIAEAEALTGLEIKDVSAMKVAAQKLVERGARAVLVKGGHMEKAIDVFFDGAALETLGGEKVKSENTHGSGCTLASAIAAGLAEGKPLLEADIVFDQDLIWRLWQLASIRPLNGPLIATQSH